MIIKDIRRVKDEESRFLTLIKVVQHLRRCGNLDQNADEISTRKRYTRREELSVESSGNGRFVITL